MLVVSGGKKILRLAEASFQHRLGGAILGQIRV